MNTLNNQELFLSASESALGETTPRKRLLQLFDSHSFVELGGFLQREEKPVELVCGYGTVNGSPVYAFSQGGPIGKIQVEKMKKMYTLAQKNGFPVVGFYDSQGLHLSEGTEILDTCGELLYYQNRLSGVVPQISVIVGPCIGTNAMLACSADYLIMAETATFFATPPTSDIPDQVGTAQAVVTSGVVHYSTPTEEQAIKATQKLLSYLPPNNLAPPVVREFHFEEKAPLPQHLTVAELLSSVFDEDSPFELLPTFGIGVYGGFASLQGSPCGIIATKGSTLSAEDCSKIARLVSVWDSFQIPVITFVDTTGMAPSEATSVRDMAKVSHVYGEATTPKIAVITGKAYGASYVALASRATNADFSVAWPGAVISPLPPATAVAFLQGGRISEQKSRDLLETEYETQHASGIHAAQVGMVDQVIAPQDTRKTLLSALQMLSSKRTRTLPKKHGNIPF